MGWSSGYAIFEATVIGAYNLGKLDKALLTVLMEPYGNSDIDSGGSNELKSKDGKTVEQIVIETWGLDLPAEPSEEDDEDTWEAYLEELDEKMRVVTGHFGW
jgi:hypothetical protein